MRSLSIREARQALTQLEQLLAAEGEVTITRRGEAIARVIPIDRKRPVPSHRELRGSIRPLATGSEVAVRKDRDSRG